MYLHYSFDVWSTLIKTNPDFSAERNNFFYRNHNPKNLTEIEVKSILSDVRAMCDHIDSVTGMSISSLEVISIILWRLGSSKADPELIRDYMERVFLAHPPLFYSDTTISTLETLKSGGANLSILSNTSFIRGTTISKFFKSTPIAKLMSFELYSDMWRMAKPNPQFYKKMLNSAYRNSIPLTKKSQIIHVGDNPITDLQGAKLFGVHALLINSNDKTIIDLL